MRRRDSAWVSALRTEAAVAALGRLTNEQVMSGPRCVVMSMPAWRELVKAVASDLMKTCGITKSDGCLWTSGTRTLGTGTVWRRG